MANDRIEVDTQVLEEEIKNLKDLINDIETNGVDKIDTKGLGFTPQYMSAVNDGFDVLIKNLQGMIIATVELFEDIKDGFLSADQVAADTFEDFKNEVLNDE